MSLLKICRTKKGFTQEKLAETAKVDRTLISKIESGKATITISMAKRLSSILDINWKSFYEDDIDSVASNTIEKESKNYGKRV